MVSKRGSKEKRRYEITLVIATYNRGEQLKKIHRDLSSQTLDNDLFEVIIVDDGSKTPAANVLDSLEWPMSFTLIRQENTGAAGARHAGIEKSQGDIIVITDDDMEIDPRFLEAHLEAHRHGADVALGRIVQSTLLSKQPLYTRHQQHHFDKLYKRWITQDELEGENLYTGNVSFKHSLYDRVGGFDLSLRLSEDRELGARFEKAGAKFLFASDAITINSNDHIDLKGWMAEARRYGALDWQFALNHEEIKHIDPFYFFFKMKPITRPVLATILAVPQVASPLTRALIKISEMIDRHSLEPAAMAGATLCYGMQYYLGVREEAGSLREILRGLRRYAKKKADAEKSA